ILFNFFFYNLKYSSDSIEVSISWMYTISYFILFFFILFFLIGIKSYLFMFITIAFFGGLAWIIIYALETFILGFWFPALTILRHISAILCFSILSPGLVLSLMHYIKNASSKTDSRKFFHKYRVHEGFIGIIFLLFALILLIIRYNLIKYEIFRTDLRIFLAADMILLYLFLFLSSFLLIRDRRDIVKLHFIQRREPESTNYNIRLFNSLTSDSIKFFKSPKFFLYPFGIFFNSIAVNIFIHGTNFLPEEVFNLNHENLVLIGIIFSLISGAIIGLDWYRLFAKIYPEIYQNFEQVLEDLRKINS
ncbi:MAG: hypothetical protein ACFFAA_13390, partial [Promethearchaeota archaeon]